MTLGSLRAFERDAFASYGSKVVDLAIYRILYASIILLGEVPVASWLPLAPKAFFHPPLGPAALFTEIPPASVLFGLNVLLLIFAAMLMVGWRTPLASVGTGLTLLILQAWAYSLGKIDHHIFFVVVPLFLAFSGWGRAHSIDARHLPPPGNDPVAPLPLALLALVVGFAMFTAGWAKITSGWLDPSVHATHGHLVQNYFFTGRETVAGRMALQVGSGWFWKAGDWSAVALEMGFLFAAVHRRALCVWMALATLFHLGILLLFDIPFPANLLAYAAFVGFTSVPAFRSLPLDGKASARSWGLVLTAAVGLGSVATLRGQSIANALHLPLKDLIVWAGAAGGLWFLRWILLKRRAYHAGVQPVME